MRIANWFLAGAVAASAGLLSQTSMAQLKKGTAAPDDVPRGKALGVATDEEVPRGKSLGAANRALAEERREARRLPVVDASATFRASQLIGLAITDAEGRTIGKVVDFISDNRGNILFPVISYTGSPGFSGKLFAIPSTGLTFQAGSGAEMTAQLAFEPQLLRNAPSFTSTRFPDFSDQTFLKELTTFYSKILPGGMFDRRTALDPTVPANGPGDRIQTQDQAGTPKLPIDPTLPANGPGDRPALVNPALPRTGAPTSPTVPAAEVGDVRTRATATPAVGENAAAARMMLRSSQMVGMPIQDKDGESIGKVVDFVGDTSGNNYFAVVSLTGDNRMIVLPYHALNFQTARGSNFAMLRVAPGQLKNAPSFTGDNWPNFTDAKVANQISQFYSTLLPTPGASRGYDYGQFPTESPDGTKYPRTATRPGTVPTPPATNPALEPKTPRPAATPRKGPMIPGPGSGAPGVPAVPSIPTKPVPGAVPGGPALTPAPGGAAPGAGAPGGSVPGGTSGPGAGGSGSK